MEYKKLNKLFYEKQSNYAEVYKQRFSAPFTEHLNFEIKQFNHDKSFPAFFCYSNEMFLLMEAIYKKFANLLIFINSVPSVVLYQFASLCMIDEVHSTSNIEGIHSTRQELKNILENKDKHSRFSSIFNKYGLLLSNQTIVFNTAEDIRKLYDEFIHKEVVWNNPADALDGKIFRKESVDVRKKSGKIVHQGLYPEDKIIEAVNAALDMVNNTNLPVLVRIAVFHYYFAYIHPFYNGNGRMARFITSCYLAKHFHYLLGLRLSITINSDKNNYYKLLHETDLEINRGDLTPVILGFMSIISKTLDNIEAILKRKTEQLEKYRKKILELVLDDYLMQSLYDLLLQASLFAGHGITIKEIIKITGKARGTIDKKIKSIPQNHIIIRKNKQNFYRLNMMIFKNQ